MTWWRFELTTRLPKSAMLDIDRRVCPDQCGGFLGRLAERQYKKPYAWIPIGWRCNKCGFAVIDNAVTV